MISKLRIKNFKAWGDQLWKDGVELAPITLFLGTNSAGKTSILQPLLLLQQTFLSPDRTLDLYLGGKKGDLVDFGTYEQIVHGHNPRVELGFGLEIGDVERVTMLRGEADAPGPGDYQRYVGVLRYEVTYGYASGTLHLKHMSYEHDDVRVSATRSAKGAYHLTGPGYAPPTSPDGTPIPKREYKPEKSVMLSDPADGVLRSYRLGIYDLCAALRQSVEEIRYLGPLRERPQATYLWGGQEPGQIGSRGEDAVPALLANLNATKRSERGAMVAEVSRWLKAMGVADELTIDQIGNSRFFEVMISTAGKEANLVHVGFGVSQVLPMIVLALTAPEGTTIIAEQPEIHLHPGAQTVLANLLVETARRRKLQFLIETHSEHMFRRLQYLVAENKQITRDECRLYFVDRTESGEPHLEHLAMDAYGRIKNWPKHFFGDAVGETERQLRAMIDRMKAERSPGAGPANG